MDVHAINIAKTVCLPLGEYIVYLAVLMNEDDPVQEQGWIGFTDVPVMLGGGDVDGGNIELLYIGTEG